MYRIYDKETKKFNYITLHELFGDDFKQYQRSTGLFFKNKEIFMGDQIEYFIHVTTSGRLVDIDKNSKHGIKQSKKFIKERIVDNYDCLYRLKNIIKNKHMIRIIK